MQYDEDRLAIPETVHKNISTPLEYEAAINAILELKNKLLSISEATELFGAERENHLQSILANLEQTMFGGRAV